MTYNDNLDVDFVGRHLLASVDSTNQDYISQKIREQIKGSSVTIILLGSQTADGDWVANEIEWRLAKEQPNGVVVIRIDPDAEIRHRPGNRSVQLGTRAGQNELIASILSLKDWPTRHRAHT